MRVGVLATVQHSMFSAGITNTSLAIAELMREFGHEVELIQMAGTHSWWDDCKSLQKFWKVVSVEQATGYDLIFEIDRMMLTTEKRREITKQSIWVIRKPFLIHELEANLFPTTVTPKRELEGLTGIWVMDAAAAVEEGSIQVLELLSKAPVRIVPFVWSPSIAAIHLQELGIPPWIDTTVDELKRLASSEVKIPPWKVHVAETNTTNTSCAILPLVILREAKRRGSSISNVKIHNADMIEKSKFFLENIVRHCCDNEVGLSGELVGRQRSVEWAKEPLSCVVSHLRFTAIRPLLLDLVWAGVPVVHNSLMLRDLGVDRSYYSDNHIGEACDAFKRMEEDFLSLKGLFAPGATNTLRSKILETVTPLSQGVKKGWQEALQTVSSVQAPMKPSTDPILRVGFCDMWESFVPEYNFFTLMLSAAGAKLDPPVRVVGGVATPTDSIVIFGPFGDAWKKLPAEQPKIHFTGENTAPVAGAKLNLGFQHFDMVTEEYLRFPLWLLEIDWFGADMERIVNPKPIPLERCTRVMSSEIARKKKFCAFVVSNPANPVRNTAFQWLSEYKHVDSAGRVFNNTGSEIFAGGGGGGGELKKLEFLKDYKFCLTYENNSARGYTTEKYLHAKAAGCIPIYWGDPAFERDFSVAGCIDARNFTSQEELVEAVRKVDENDSEWLKRFSVPALDPYRVAWAHRTMAECARRMFGLGGFNTNSFPVVIGDVPVVTAAPVVAPAVAPVVAPVVTTLETPLMITFATRKYLSSLHHWLTAIKTQTSAMQNLNAIVFLSSDVPEDTGSALKEKFDFVTFETVPDSAPPTDAFADFWDPQHFGWKLWILKTLCGRSELSEKMVFYMDAGSFLCRWPQAWMRKAQATGICFLEDPREENKRWCSAEFCAALQVTESELASQQIQAANILFRAGCDLASSIFEKAFELAKRRDILAGPKWAGMVDGKPHGHRHDQSILSILALRHRVSTEPLDSICCSTSLRKTFTSGRSIYAHRGNFQVHKDFSESINEAYVINLDRRGDRMDRLWENCPELKGRVDRWSAIDGRSLELTPHIQRLLKPNDFFWKKAVSGCALSHLGLWWKLAKDTPDIKNYLILEDDVKLRPGWENIWKAAVDDIPENYDILYLGGVLPPNRDAFEKACKERVNDSFCRIKENTQWGQQSPNRYFHFCAYAYVLSKQGAQKILNLITAHDGFWTSADHVLCNPVDVLKAYILDPIVAGCYQDDDPKYANSQFNDFSRIDGFDSDLWNNDERFRVDTLPDCELNIGAALEDARNPVKAVEPVTALAHRKPVTNLPRRFVALAEQNLDISHLHEGTWLQDLCDRPTTFPIDKIRYEDPPPTDEPVVIVQRPHIGKISNMLEKWDSFGVKFHILHLSDEYGQDDISFYNLSGCQKVLRFYKRENLPEKVTTIPLGFHWTLNEGSKNVLEHTPKLPFRTLTWSFFGTDWNDRKKLLQPLFDISGEYKAQFFKDWKDPAALDESAYISTLLDTIFVPCPDGMNPETFRFYEALECGCIPIVVRTEANSEWVDWVAENLQMFPLHSWSEASKFMEGLISNKTMLESYRTRVLIAWIQWRATIKDDVRKFLEV